MKVADYVLSELDEKFPEYLVPVDYRQPKEPYLEDSTASAITASGLLELARLLSGEIKVKTGAGSAVDSADADKYLTAAIKLLKVLDEKRSDYTTNKDNILEKCTAAYHDAKHEFAIIYGDYYYIEALMKLTGNALEVF